MFGREHKPLAVPAGYLTDGINYYRNPGNLKPENPEEVSGRMNGVGIFDGIVPAPPMPAAKK